MIYAEELDFDKALADIYPYLDDHYYTAIDFDLPLKPVIAAYEHLWGTGVIDIFSARDDDKLVGYILTLIQADLHSEGNTIGYNDMIYLKEEYRHTEVASEFMEALEEHLKSKKVNQLYFDFPMHNQCAALMDHLEYDKVGVKYSKII